MELGFGYNQGLPEGVRAAWGARLIVDQDGHTDFLHDRVGSFGEQEDRDAVISFLNSGAMQAARARASELLRSYTMLTRHAEEFVLYEDDSGVIVGNTNGSAGYLYVAAYLRAHVPQGVA
jgi:hypothetical protein